MELIRIKVIHKEVPDQKERLEKLARLLLKEPGPTKE